MKKIIRYLVLVVLLFSLVTPVADAASKITLSAKLSKSTLKYNGSAKVNYSVKKNGKIVKKPKVSFSSSNKKIVTVSSKGVVKSKNVGKAYVYVKAYGKKVKLPVTVSRKVWSVEGKYKGRKVDTSFDNKYVSAGSSLYDLKNGNLVKSFAKNNSKKNSIFFWKDGLVHYDGSIFDYFNCKFTSYNKFKLFNPNNDYFFDVKNGVSYASQNKSKGKVVNSDLDVVEIDDVETGRNAAALSVDGSILATAYDDTRVVLNDTKTGNVIKEFKIDNKEVRGITFTKDNNKLLLSVTNVDEEDFMVYVYDTDSNVVLKKFGGPYGVIGEVKISPDGKRIALLDMRGVKMYDSSYKLLYELKMIDKTSMNFTKDSKYLIVAGGDVTKYYVK
ncbi:hypothetical protein MKZ08_08790 [Viridibacillus sp. FSL R5-0477]|uniref:WD40 repeat-containing protein n=1 Tax=Viridibacillus arenosi FSL R5-213 TaxID=1227360 RepID=W4EUC5_9BACL|nr:MULTISPECIES: hypothetical protein [Viridibacillus]ETT84113.1 WD40 repeat-containing protein [Viridibacillus arenosi FSL R5-213]OMC79301.1 hypothetical protein BK130_19145 [Viridibacillus sp. FSL H8-0123]OMC90088.1 hypothetical protein BK137_15210 [Viridibacillus arenosi]